MKFRIQVVAVSDDGLEQTREIASLERDDLQPETLGLTLAESKAILKDLQEIVVQRQATDFIASQRCCPVCGRVRKLKGYHTLKLRTVFGKLEVKSPRLHHCDCRPQPTRTYSPLGESLPEHTTPELLFLETKWAALVSYGLTAKLLEDVLPMDEPLNAFTIRRHVFEIAERMENTLGEEQVSFIESCPRDRDSLPLPDGPLAVGIDGGFVRGRRKEGNFEVIVGKSILSFQRDQEEEEQTSKCFAFVQTFDTKPKRRLFELLKSQGMRENQQIVFLSDGGEDVRNLQLYLSPEAEHILDWFHLSMRKLLQTINGFYGYIERNRAFIPNYGERYRNGERIGTGFVESATTIVGFLYDAPDSRFFSFNLATMSSAMAILTLNVVAMAMQEGGGMIASFVSRGPEGILARRLALGGVMTLIVVWFLTEWGEQASVVQPQAQKAMLIVMGIAIITALVWHAMRDIKRLEIRRLQAEALEVRRLQAEASAMFNPAECLNFRYEYDVLSEGLLPRFIVCAQGLTEDIFRTHTCVILRFEDGRALVKADVENKKVFIHVTGKADARRRLLAVIRSDFERIHADLKFKPAELVPLIGHPDEAVTYKELVVYEQNGITEFTKVVGSNIVKVDVQQHLNGVDLAGTRRRESRREELEELREDPARVFISYSHKDERFRLALEPHLKLLQRQRLIADWHDRLIEPGAEWASVIDANLEDAKIILLLVSADFIASDYCWEIEMKRALERHEKGEACVLPIIIRESKWDTAPFAKLQVLPENGKAVDLWKRKDQAWRSVADGIEKIAKEL